MAAEVKEYKNTGLRYIRGAGKTLVGMKNNNGIAVMNADFDAWDSADILLAQILGLANDPAYSGYDFEYTIRTNSLSDQRRAARTAKAPVPSAPPPLSNPSNPSVTAHPMNQEKVLIDSEREETMLSAGDTQVLSELAYDEAVVRKAFEETMALEKEGDVVLPKLTVKQQVLAFLHGDRTGKQKEKSKHRVSIHDSVAIMLAVIVVVGLGSMAMSGYHIYANMFDGGRPQLVALVTGIIMTLFSAIAFTAARYFTNGHKFSDKLVGIAFGLFGVIVVAFAMFSTMKVNFDQFKAGADSKVTVKVEVATAVKAVDNKTAFATSELARLDADIAQQTRNAADAKRKWQAQVDLGKDADVDLKWQYWSAKGKAEKQILADQEERKPYAAAKLGSGDAAVAAETKVKQDAENGTIFGLLRRLFGIDQETILFIVYVIPAIFYDLMCPFALTVGMMLYDRMNEPREEEKE